MVQIHEMESDANKSHPENYINDTEYNTLD